MGWIKTHLPDELHGKLKSYRDRHDFDSLVDAVQTCVVKELNRDEKENGTLSTENKTEHPTWNDD